MARLAHGFSLIEVMIAMAILALLLGLAAPSYTVWIANARIRSGAQSVQSGLQFARSQAVTRNSRIRFQLVTTVGADCALIPAATLTPNSTNWVVSFDDPVLPVNKCASPPLNDLFSASDSVNNPAPRIIKVRPATDGSNAVQTTVDQSVIIFDGLGRVTPQPGVNPLKIDFLSAQGTCVGFKCLRVTVSAGGLIRMCDPNPLLATTDTQRC